MKKSIFMVIAAVAMVMFGCKESPYMAAPGENELVPDSVPELKYPDPTPDPEGADVPDSCLNVYEARKIAQSLHGKTSDKKYYIKGWVCRLDEKNTDGIESYGNATFFISATNDGTADKYTFEAYQVYGKDGKQLASTTQVEIGDFVVIYGQIMKYGDQPETPGKGSAYIHYSTNKNFDPVLDPTKITPDPEGANVPDGTLNVYEARAKCDSIGNGGATKEEYYIKGWIFRLHSQNADGITGNYHNATFYIAATNDGTTVYFPFEAYRVKGPNKKDITSVDQVQVGDFVVLKAKLKNYGGVAETDNGGYIYYSSNPLLK